MADEVKKNKHVEALGSFESFKAPWETEAGEVDIDKGRLKKYLFDVLSDKAKHQDAREDAESQIADATTKATEAETAKKAAEKKLADADSTGQITELQGKLSDATGRADTAEGKLLRIEVGDDKGLSREQSMRLQGATKDELEKDADKVIELFGIVKPGKDSDDEDDDDDEDDEDEEPTVRTTPTTLRNPADSRPGASGGAGPQSEADFEKAIAEASRGRVFG